MKRIDGYVVGPKTVRGSKTWSVMVKHKGHPRDGQKLTVTSVAPRVTLFPSLDVDFYVREQTGQSIVTDVAPRGTKREGNRMMRKYSIAIFGGVTVLLLASLAVFWSQASVIKNAFEVMKVQQVLDRIETIAFETMVPDSVIVQAIERGADAYAAREAVFDKHLCSVFGDLHRDHGKCYNALYSSGIIEGNYWYEKTGIPIGASPIVEGIRNKALTKWREFQRDPGKLISAYKLKKDLIVKTYRSLNGQRVGDINGMLISANRSFKRFYDADVQAAYLAYMEAKNLWDESHYLKWAVGRPGTEEELRKQQDDAQSHSYRLVSDASAALSKIVPDMYWTLYAGRRHKDTGKVLVATYVAISNDLLKEIGVED